MWKLPLAYGSAVVTKSWRWAVMQRSQGYFEAKLLF
jgi:hypothetical protein